MMELIGTIIANIFGTAIGNRVPKDALKKPSRRSKRADDHLIEARARLWRGMYVMRCIETGRIHDTITLIKFDALVMSYKCGEITYREFSDELDRLDNPVPPLG